MKKIINVTKADIKHGKRGDCHACMLGLAIARRVKPETVSLTSSCGNGNPDASLSVDVSPYLYVSLPEKAMKNEFLFESRQRVKPFRFVLDLPAKLWKRKGAK